MNKHTPGPWTTEGADITNGYPEQGARVLIAEKVFNEHDAHLIAAAPAMYEALKSALNNLDRLADERSHYRTMWLYHARAALAQAEGRD